MHQAPASPDWMEDAVFYEIFPDRFDRGAASGPARGPDADLAPWGSEPDRDRRMGGDLDGITRRLPYVAGLGANAIYLTPIFAARTNHRYDTHDYLAVDPALGGDEALRRLTRRAHELGIRVVLDGVFNHCGSSFPPFRDLLARGSASPYRSWFTVEDGQAPRERPLSYATCGGAGYLPKLNTDNPELRAYLMGAIEKWIRECDIDGWRMDVPWKVGRGFWDEAAARIKAAKPSACMIGEFWRDSGDWALGGPFDSIMNYRWRSHVLDFCAYGAMDAEDFLYELLRLHASFGSAAGRQFNLLGSHDTPRVFSLCAEDERRLELALLVQFTDLGMPALYYGDELGMRGGNDPECRGAMDWGEALWNRELLERTKRLASIRAKAECLRRGSFHPVKAFNRTLAFARVSDKDAAIVVANAGPETCALGLDLPEPLRGESSWDELLGGGSRRSERGVLRLPPLPEYSGYCFYRELR